MLHTGCTMGPYSMSSLDFWTVGGLRSRHGTKHVRNVGKLWKTYIILSKPTSTEHCGSEDPDSWWFYRDYKVDYPPQIKYLWVCLKDSKSMEPQQKWWLNTPLSYSNGHKLGIYPHIDLCTWGASVLLPALGSGPQVLLTETINMDQDWNVCIYISSYEPSADVLDDFHFLVFKSRAVVILVCYTLELEYAIYGILIILELKSLMCTVFATLWS